jgi:hypothetical protein
VSGRGVLGGRLLLAMPSVGRRTTMKRTSWQNRVWVMGAALAACMAFGTSEASASWGVRVRGDGWSASAGSRHRGHYRSYHRYPRSHRQVHYRSYPSRNRVVYHGHSYRPSRRQVVYRSAPRVYEASVAHVYPSRRSTYRYTPARRVRCVEQPRTRVVYYDSPRVRTYYRSPHRSVYYNKSYQPRCYSRSTYSYDRSYRHRPRAYVRVSW